MAEDLRNRRRLRTPRRHLLSRRLLLQIGLGTLGAITVAGSAARWLFWGRLKEVYLRVAYPALPPGLRGRLDTATLAVLKDVTELLLGAPPAERYLRYFEWHATHVGGYRSIYRDFVGYLETRAGRDQGLPFADCTAADKRALLSGIMQQRVHPNAGSDLTRLWKGALHRRLVIFDRFILQEILNLYSKTDAWLAVGYEAFPGMPAGLESYRQAP